MNEEQEALTIPKSIRSKLPSQRGEIERLQKWRVETLREIEALEGGRRDLAQQIEAVENERRAGEANILNEANSIADRIRQGLGWSPAPAKTRTVLDDSDLKSARKALDQLDADLGGLRLRVSRIDDAIGDAVRDCLREEHSERRKRYAELREEMRQLIAEMNGCASLAGVGKFPVVFDLPTQDGDLMPLRIDENHVGAIRKEWEKLANALRANPARLPSLKFPQHDPKAVKQLVYHEMTKSERKRIDDNAGAANVVTGINPASLGVRE